MSDQLKPRLEQGQRLSLSQEQPPSPLMDDDEAQMRRALGLVGDGPRPRLEGDRPEPTQRAGGFMQGVHRRRFVQDGEVPVTVVRRDSPETSHASGSQAGPTSSRLQRVEAALTAETAARDRAERALHEAQAALQALQTKIGHNELAKNEAIAASKRDREEIVSLREEIAAGVERLNEAETRAGEAEDELRAVRAELAEERRARKTAERLLEEATNEPVMVNASGHAPLAVVGDGEPARVPARRGRPPMVHAEPDSEQEPVKWWLVPAKTVGKRR